MGVMYHAHARFMDRKQGKITVPAPIDPTTPHVPWWYDYIAAKGQELAEVGFTAIMYPPVSKTQSGRWPTGDGYGVFDQYDIGWKDQAGARETRFGDRERLQRSIAIARACGMDVYLDVVMHQQSGSNGGDGVYRYVGADGTPGTGRFPKDPGCFRGTPPRRPQDPVPSAIWDFSFGDEFVYANSRPARYTINGMVAFGDWLTRSLDVQGFRVDDVKGTWVGFVKEWMTSRAMATRFCVSEYFEGNPDTLAWWAQDQMGGRSAVYDFTLHWALQDVCDNGGDMRRLDRAGYIARAPFGAVTFVDNPDTDLSPGEQIVGSKLLAYAYILTAEGYPAVYHKDYAQEAGCYGLKRWIDNLVWIHEHLANGGTLTRFADQRVIALERQGWPGLLTAISNDPINRHTVTCQTSFPAATQLHDYTGRHGDIWTDPRGCATFTVPSNAFGSGQSYLCFSRTGQDKGPNLQGHTTVQRFFGASDLDIGPVANLRPRRLPRIHVAADQTVQVDLTISHQGWTDATSVKLAVFGPDGSPLADHGWRAASGREWGFRPRDRGWHTLELSGTGLPAATPFELEMSYRAPRTL
jgi:alpha-amylase